MHGWVRPTLTNRAVQSCTNHNWCYVNLFSFRFCCHFSRWCIHSHILIILSYNNISLEKQTRTWHNLSPWNKTIHKFAVYVVFNLKRKYFCKIWKRHQYCIFADIIAKYLNYWTTYLLLFPCEHWTLDDADVITVVTVYGVKFADWLQIMHYAHIMCNICTYI